MDEITVVAESVLKIEIKQEPPECLVKTEPIELDVPIMVKREVKTEDSEEEELEPPATVFVEPKDVTIEEVVEESENPLAMCVENVFVVSDSVKQVKETDEQKLIRPVLQKTCSEGGALTHKQKHTGGSHECTVCQKSFTLKQNLFKHMGIHTGEKHTCSVCEKSFSRRDSLVSHKWIHTEEKPHSCSVCRKSFTKKSQLTTCGFTQEKNLLALSVRNHSREETR